MTTVAVIQARLGSTRLPGKVLADLGGAPMIDRVVARARRARRVDEVWVATTNLPEDDRLARHCDRLGVALYRGDSADVLSRYRGAAEAAGATSIVRITADCPLLDPAVVDAVVLALQGGADYAANVLERSYPRGLDVEAFTAAALHRMDALGRSAASREHVTLGPRQEHPEHFQVRSIRADQDDSDLRWTVDLPEDLGFVRRVYRELGLADRYAPYREVVRWCRANPGMARRDNEKATWDPRGADRHHQVGREQ